MAAALCYADDDFCRSQAISIHGWFCLSRQPRLFASPRVTRAGSLCYGDDCWKYQHSVYETTPQERFSLA